MFFLSGTEGCSSNNETEEMGTSINGKLSINFTSGNKTHGGVRSSRDASQFDRTIIGQNNVIGKWFRM